MSVRTILGRPIRRAAERFGYTIVGSTAGWLPLLCNPVLKLAGMQLALPPSRGKGFVDCKTTVESARAAGLTVSTYAARLWSSEEEFQAFCRRLKKVIPLQDCRRILEIGPGTGRFLEAVIRAAKPEIYEIYETNADWSDYLAVQYGVFPKEADGVSLSQTPTGSRDLVHAHLVFVYLPVVTAFGYFREMCRVCAAGGYVMFDAYLDAHLDLPTVENWRESLDTWQVVLPKNAIVELFRNEGFELAPDIYETVTHKRRSQYLIFKKLQS